MNINLEDYKPNKEIIELADEVLELWFGNFIYYWIIKLRDCSIIYHKEKNEIEYILDSESNYLFCLKDLILYTPFSYDDCERISPLLMKCFNFHIEEIV